MPAYADIVSRVSVMKDYAWQNDYDSIRVFILNEMFGYDDSKLREFVNAELLRAAPHDGCYWDFVTHADDGVFVVVPVVEDAYVYKNTLPGVLYL